MGRMRLSIALAAALLAGGLLAPALAAEDLSSDAFAVKVAAFLGGLDARSGTTRSLGREESIALVGIGAKYGMNVFELFDAVYRWASAARVRLRFGADSLHEVARVFDIGRERVRALLPLDQMTSLEVGVALASGQPALSATLPAPYSEYVELGTIKLSEAFGFGALEPNRYLKPYGISVVRFPVAAPLDRLELYAPRKGAIYVAGAPRPKRWNLWPITKR